MTAVNPGHLKVELALGGVAIDASVRTRPELLPALRDARHVLELLLPEDVVVDAPLANGRVVPDLPAPHRLAYEGEHAFLQREPAIRIEVRVIPPPQFYHANTPRGVPMRRIGSVFGSFIALNPLTPESDGPCTLCSGRPTEYNSSEPHPIVDVVDTVRAAFAEGAVEFVLFNASATEAEDGGIAALEPYIRAVKRNFDTFVAVQMHPPRNNRWVDRTYAMGVDALTYSVEVHDADILARCYPGRVAIIGRERYYEALAHAASIFPSGTVWSEFTVGIEPAESTMRGIDTLVQAGVLPVVSLAPPRHGLALGDAAAQRAEEVAPMLAHLFQATRQSKINMGWVRELSFGITPLEARFFAGEEARLSVAQQFYRSRLGGMAARNLARLRRRLRVRTVSDSFDSSRL